MRPVPSTRGILGSLLATTLLLAGCATAGAHGRPSGRPAPTVVSTPTRHVRVPAPPAAVYRARHAGALDAQLAAERRARHVRGSLITEVAVPGARTGYRYPARAYVPAAYFSRAWAHRTFPVLEVFGGSRSAPGAPFGSIPLQQSLDRAIAAGAMPPTIVIGPTRNPVPLPDTQCLDDPHGRRMLTYLGDDVPAAVEHLFRARPDRGGWATLGTSSGAYCAVNIAVRRPERFSAVVSLSGYFSGPVVQRLMTAPAANQADRLANRPLTQVRKVRQPMSFVLVSARDDHDSYRELQQFAAVLKRIPADDVDTIVTPSGRHTARAWRGVMPLVWTELGRALGWPHPRARR